MNGSASSATAACCWSWKQQAIKGIRTDFIQRNQAALGIQFLELIKQGYSLRGSN
jgi:hypothetical protein